MKFHKFRKFYKSRYRPDFVVPSDSENLGTKIIYQLFYLPITRKFPMIVFIGGGSGHGKSNGALSFQEAILKENGLQLKDYIDDINIYFPTEYPTKSKAMLTEPRLKNVRMIAIHEARDLISSKMWQSFISQTIADVNAQSRAIRPLIIFIVSQHIRNITTDVRYTLNFRVRCIRPLFSRTRAFIERVIDDDKDLEKPRILTKKVSGFLKYPDGHKRVYSPSFVELYRVDKELIEHFDKMDKESKLKIIRRKLAKMMGQLNAEFGNQEDKIDLIVNYYSSHPEAIAMLGKRKKDNSWKLDKTVASMFEIPIEDVPILQNKLNNKLKESGHIIDEADNIGL